MDNRLYILDKKYRNVFITQNRDSWNVCPFEFDKDKDLVLSFDFAVVNEVRQTGGQAYYIDHLVNSQLMEEYNHKMYEFFAKWHKNLLGKDIFSYKGMDVASAFRIEIWNDLTFYMRILVNLHELFKKIKPENVYVGIENQIVREVIGGLNIKVVFWNAPENKNSTEYYFPIFRWMDEALHPADFKHKVRLFVFKIFGSISSFIKKIKFNKNKKQIYVEWYHPTNDIIRELKRENKVEIVRSGFNCIQDMFNSVYLPAASFSGSRCYKLETEKMLKNFDKEKCATLSIDDIDMSNEIYKLIIKRVSPLIPRSLLTVDIIMKFFAKKKLSLMITVASIGLINRLMINYCIKADIPVYMIINGWLGNSFLDEAKDGTWINSYSESVKKNYFKGMKNVICLGDPRMDKYVNCLKKKYSDYENPTIGIGAAGFTNVDLNCYVAIEWEFLNDIMQVCKKIITSGKKMSIIIKVRQNGYIQQYRNFLDEYYSDVPVVLEDSVSIEEVYKKADFFISIYSQSLFEASCYGLPVLYYKNDTQYFDPPFDGNSELITAMTPDDLRQKIEAFYNKDAMYDKFKEKKVMEKYIGLLDGQNLKRNMDFIYSFIEDKKQAQAN
ncbi:MAG: hypothetical protein GY853_11535 [PVC group bacterium]|nr:hypothetical protein [PVC group bacterium]